MFFNWLFQNNNISVENAHAWVAIDFDDLLKDTKLAGIGFESDDSFQIKYVSVNSEVTFIMNSIIAYRHSFFSNFENDRYYLELVHHISFDDFNRIKLFKLTKHSEYKKQLFGNWCDDSEFCHYVFFGSHEYVEVVTSDNPMIRIGVSEKATEAVFFNKIDEHSNSTHIDKYLKYKRDGEI